MEVEARTISSKSQPDASPNDASANKLMSRIRTDFDGILELAEKLQQSYEEKMASRQSISIIGQIYGFFLVLELLAAYISMGLLLFNRSGPYPSHLSHSADIICIGSLAIIVVLGIITFSCLNSLRQRSQKIWFRIKVDERDLAKVVELLREIEPIYAKEERLSALERVQIRIRLSRFGIGSSSQGEISNSAKEFKEEFQSRKSRVDQELMKPF